MLKFESLEKLRRLLALIDEGRVAVSDLLRATSDLRIVTRGIVDRPDPPDPTFVYLLPVEGPFLAQRAFVMKKCSDYVVFEPYVELAPGAWVVVVGPAIVHGVKVGNQMQSSMADYQGHVCKTTDPCPVGARITVELVL